MTCEDYISMQKECDEKFLDNELKWIKSQQDYKIILMGDIIDASLKTSPGSSVYDTNMNVEEQYEHCLKKFAPFKDNIIGLIQGNHEERITRETGLDISKIMARELGVNYFGHSSLIKIKVGTQNYDIYATHGSSGATTHSGRLNSLMKLSKSFYADCYLMGHTHDLFTHSDIFRTFRGENKRYYVLTGHFLNWLGSYAQNKDFPPTTKGMAKIKLFKDVKDIRVHI